MIYFDNSATTLQKPPAVAEAVQAAMGTFGNPGRSFCPPAMEAARAVDAARCAVAELTGLKSPLSVAFTSGATESLNLVLGSLIGPEDHVITSVLEHNAVLRPLYKTGCALSVLSCDESARLQLDALDGMLRANTRFVVCTHGSNLTGTVTDVAALYGFCQGHGLTLILDVSQTLGSIETLADMADILCFTGHKALFGPQGTGGILARDGGALPPAKTGGTGENSFDRLQPPGMPDAYEAGTANAHGLAGLEKGVAYINALGIAEVTAREDRLYTAFIDGVSAIPGVRLYGAHTPPGEAHLPVAALNIAGRSAADVALRLWEGWWIVTRAGSHCAPLAHRRFGTEAQGMVRFSFSLFNTPEEIGTAIEALETIAAT